MTRLLPALLCLWTATLPAAPLQAATLQTEITPAMAEMGCTARLDGPITEGLLERIRPFLERRLVEGWGETPAEQALVFRNFSPASDFGDGFFVHRLCLNSEGGSLQEAMRIVSYLRHRGTQTADGVTAAVARGDACISACAYIFLAGRFTRFAGLAGYDGANSSNALLHPLGLLQLHAPELRIPDEARFSGQEVRGIWGVGMEASALILRQIANGSLFLHPDLFARSLTHLGSDMLTIETVGQTVRWGIEIESVDVRSDRLPQDDTALAEAICRNAAALVPDYIELAEADPIVRARAMPAAAGQSVPDQHMPDGFRDRLSGRLLSCELAGSTLAGLRMSLRHYAQDDDWRVRMRYACGPIAVVFRLPESDCWSENCEITVEAPCLAAFPPDTPLQVLAPPPPP